MVISTQAAAEPRVISPWFKKDGCVYFDQAHTMLLGCLRVPPPKTCTKETCTVTLSPTSGSPTKLVGCGEAGGEGAIGSLNLNFSSTNQEVNRSDFHSVYDIHTNTWWGKWSDFFDFEYSVNGGAWRNAGYTEILKAYDASNFGNNTIRFRAPAGALIQGEVYMNFYFSLIDNNRKMVEDERMFFFAGGTGCNTS